MDTEPILTPGEWEALLYGTSGDLQRLVARLAVRHGHLKPSTPEDCPVCHASKASA